VFAISEVSVFTLVQRPDEENAAEKSCDEPRRLPSGEVASDRRARYED
jgi:hypothetical protein